MWEGWSRPGRASEPPPAPHPPVASSWQVSSFSETRAQQILQQKPAQYLHFNQQQLSRIYPSPYRVDSSNYNPQPFWNAGCQMGACCWDRERGPQRSEEAGLGSLDSGFGEPPPHPASVTGLALGWGPSDPGTRCARGTSAHVLLGEAGGWLCGAPGASRGDAGPGCASR